MRVSVFANAFCMRISLAVPKIVMKVNVYSSIVISVCTQLRDNVLVECAICLLLSYVSRSRYGQHVCEARFLIRFISTQPFDDEWSLKLDTASNYVITWLRIHWRIDRKDRAPKRKRRKKREINKNIARYLSSWLVGWCFFLALAPLHSPTNHLTYIQAEASNGSVMFVFTAWFYPLFLALLFVLISATILLLCFVQAVFFSRISFFCSMYVAVFSVQYCCTMWWSGCKRERWWSNVYISTAVYARAERF